MEPEVDTASGRVRGSEVAGIRIFRGIPFGRSPEGVLRFQPPLPPVPWVGVRPARRAGPAPPQSFVPVLGMLNPRGREPEEDCLNLNLWTPGLDGARRPVLVYIHGGGFLIGSGSTALYDGRELARRGDLVVVTFNYRLGALGFVHLGPLLGGELRDATNAGLRDQIALLEWVRDNIERFGGDPRNVTLCGHSAGAMSIGALLGAPRARPLFQRAICQSGAASNVLEPEIAKEVASTFLRHLGGPAPSPVALGRISVRRILEAQLRTLFDLSNLSRTMVFAPTVDGDLIPEPPLDALRAGGAAHIPLITGTTLDEWRLFRAADTLLGTVDEQFLLTRLREVLAMSPRRSHTPRQALKAYRDAVLARGGSVHPKELWTSFQSARHFHVPSARLAEAHARAGGRAYAYLFTWRSPSLRRTLGACHGLDIPFMFGRTQHPLARPFTGLSASAARLSQKIQESWIRFARSGDPGHENLPDWPLYEGRHRLTMILGRQCSLDFAPLEAERQLLERWG